ncbi:MAG: NAD-dependent epimerase/dehydratase family protein [Gemmatimonadaceae bacterium]
MAEHGAVAFVTGGTGFVGSHLVESLLGAGWRVRCLVRHTSDRSWLPERRAEEVRGSLLDAGALEKGLDGVDTVFHLAGLTSARYPHEYATVNVEGTWRLVAAVRARAPAATFLFCSTLAAAGPAPPGGAVIEADPPRPIGPYGTSKLEAERVVAASGLRHVIVRPPTVYGPRDRDVLAMFRLAWLGLAPRLGPPAQRLSMVYVTDLVEGIRLAAQRAAPGSLYYLSGATHSWREVVQALSRLFDRRVRELGIPGPLARVAATGSRAIARVSGAKPLLTPERIMDMLQSSWACDDSRARAELGYSPRVTLEEGLRTTAAWYRTHGWL